LEVKNGTFLSYRRNYRRKEKYMALFDKSALTYDEWCQTPFGSFVDSLEKKLLFDISRPQKEEKALDLGCGTGISSLFLAEHGLDVVGIDISEKMLKKACEKARKQNRTINFIHGDIHHLPFPDETFDLVFANMVLEFVKEPDQVLTEALRVTKKGGRIVIGLIGKDSYFGKLYADKKENDPDSVFAHAHFFSFAEIETLSQEYFTKIYPGLYISQEEFTDVQKAWEKEEERKEKLDQKDASFIVGRWDKHL
jgi:ubiquinone/menaquinone biosynthesis C-methylase UbiE